MGVGLRALRMLQTVETVILISRSHKSWHPYNWADNDTHQQASCGNCQRWPSFLLI